MTPQLFFFFFLAQKQPHRKVVGVGGETMMSSLGTRGHALVPPASLRCTSKLVVNKVVSKDRPPAGPPLRPQTNPPHPSPPPTERRAAKGGICWGGRGADRPGEGNIRPQACAAWLLLFHNFGYKVIQLKEVTENKAMREEGGGVYSAWREERGLMTFPPSPVRWLRGRKRGGGVRLAQEGRQKNKKPA